MFARQNPGRRRVRFPDEVMFEESIKESDGHAIMSLLRRTSVNIDVDRINMAGMTALHQVMGGKIRVEIWCVFCIYSPERSSIYKQLISNRSMFLED